MENSARRSLKDIIFGKMLVRPMISISAFILASQDISISLPELKIFAALMIVIPRVPFLNMLFLKYFSSCLHPQFLLSSVHPPPSALVCERPPTGLSSRLSLGIYPCMSDIFKSIGGARLYAVNSKCPEPGDSSQDHPGFFISAC